MTNRTEILACVVLLIALAVLGTVMQMKFPPRIDLPFDTQSTILAAEFASGPEEINAVLATDHRYAKALEQQQYIDFPFILCYVALFIVLSLALGKYDAPGARWVSWLAMACAVAAGACDVAENIAILKTVTGPGLLSDVRSFSIPKWCLVFLLMTVDSGVFFFWPRLTLWWRVAGIAVGGVLLFVGASGLLFSALVSIPDILWSANWMSWAMAAALAFLVAVLVRMQLAGRRG